MTTASGRRFESAGAPWRRWCIAKTLAQTVVFWGVFLFLIPPAIVAAEAWLEWPRFAGAWAGQRWVAAVVFAAAGSLGLWSGFVMAGWGLGTPLPLDPPRRLVIAGPYRFVRNPMAIAGLMQGAAVGVWLGSWGVLLYVVTGFFVWNFGVRQWEERELVGRFGVEYERYRGEVWCWWPRWRGYFGEE